MIMKKTLLFLATLFMTGLCQTVCATEIGDTLVIEKPDKVKIVTCDTVQRIIVSGMKDNPYFHYTQHISIPDTTVVRRKWSNLKDFNKVVIKDSEGNPSKWEGSGHLYMGLGTMLSAPEGYSMWPTFELGIGATADYHPFGKKNTWSAGLLFGLKSLHTRSSRYWVKVDDVMTQVPVEKEYEYTYASITSLCFQVPLLYTHKFDNCGRWSVTLGALVNWNIGATAQRHYSIGDNDVNINTNHIGHRPFTVDGVVVFNAPYAPAIYCKYCPMTFFKDGRGPKMKLLTFGVCL